jgi:hypothetical protein
MGRINVLDAVTVNRTVARALIYDQVGKNPAVWKHPSRRVLPHALDTADCAEIVRTPQGAIDL